MSAPEPHVLEALRGRTEGAADWPGPRALNIYLASAYNEFREERRQLLELVGPELQAAYDDRYIEVELVDMHYGADGGDDCNPALLRHRQRALRHCHRTSKAGYFLCLLGGDASSYQPVLPFRIEAQQFEALVRAESAQSQVVRAAYTRHHHGHYTLDGDDKWFSNLVERDEQRQRLSEVQDAFTRCALDAVTDGRDLAHLLRSPVELQCELALELLSSGAHPKGVVAVFRDTTVPDPQSHLAKLAYNRLKGLRKKIEEVVPPENIITLQSSSTDSSRSDPPSDREERLAPLRERVLAALGALLDESLSAEPDQGKGRKKTVQEVFLEHITHLRICIDHNRLCKVNVKQVEDVAKGILSNIKDDYENRSKHPPVLIYGTDASGKSTLLTHLYFKCEEIFPNPVLRIIRFSASTPRSAYNLELLRVMCQQISIILNIPEGYLPKDASFDPLYINNWFQSLLKRCEDMENETLLIFIDNVHRVNPLECDIVTGLSWLPMSLPRNVFLVCTSAVPLEQLQLTPAQKEKFRAQSCYCSLDAIDETPENKSCGNYIDGAFDNLEVVFGSKAFSKLAGYITCSEFGLTELELLELLMPTSNSEAVISLEDANFNFSTLCVAKNLMECLLLENVVSGRLTWRWRAAAAGAVARRRYVRVQSALRDAHSDLAALHFANFLADGDDTDTEEARELGCAEDDDAPLDSRPFHSGARAAAAFTQRHVEEAWLHLLLAGDFAKLKDLTVCNFDFLLAAVQTVTISYLRCILEHVRCYILDRDVELVYGAVRKASDILTRDPMQLGAQIIAWLRPAVARRGVLATLVTSAMAWCDGYDKPLLVPLNGWLHPPIASTVRVVCVGGAGAAGAGGRLLQLAPSGQHLLLAPAAGDPQLWHIMSNSKVHTFKGHSGRVLCMCVTRESQYLVTGSEDTSVIVWDLHTLAIKIKILEHIAPVLCVAAVVSRSLVISGGEDSAVILTSLLDGALVTKLDHHRGPVTGVKVIQDGEILVTCSQDGTVCTWNVVDFTLLSTVAAGAPVHAMDVTDDNVFLVTLQADNELHLRTFITGTHLHVLKRHKAKVKCFCVGHDSSRAAVGCADQRVYLYSLHTAQLLRTLAAAHDLAALAVADKDHFLLAAGGNRVTIYSFHTEDHLTNFRPTKQLKRRPTKSTTNVTLLQAEQSELIPISCLEVSRDGQLAASGCARGLVRVWQLSTHKLQATLSGHMGHVTCVTFSPNNLLVLSGSEDRTALVWQLTDNSPSLTYKGHTAALQSLVAMADGRRAMSADRARAVHVWLADSGIVLLSASGPAANIAVTLNMKFAVLSDGENSVRIWSLSGSESAEDKRSVSHAERVTCVALTADSQHLVTGSMDMSLKVWQLDGGKLSQVLVGHSGIVTCVAVSITNKTQVVSGSWDCNLIVWDINTGTDIHLLSGHLGKVTCVKVTGDGTIAVSGAEDKTLIIWETKRGLALTSLALHVPLLGFQITSDSARIVVHLLDRGCLPIICLHNTPATYVKIPTYAAPTKDVDELRPLAPKRPMRRLLKKEVSLDTYTWQKKYGHLTSAAMMAQVDERLKRRFSVSASMEEISKIQEAKNKDLGSQVSLGPEEAAIAQSQHFDQLEALWNKISPPRRRSNKTLAKQSSLVESRFDSSDEEHTPVDEQEHMVE